MKKIKLFLFVFVAILSVGLISCGSKGDKKYDVTVDTSTIGGKLSPYFTLEEKTYKYEKGIIDKVVVELKCIEPLPENLKAYIGVEVLDKDNTVISAGKPDVWSFSDYDILRQATPGQIVTIEISNHNNVGEEKPSKIRLSSIIEEEANRSAYNSSISSNDADEVSDIESDDERDSDSTGSTDWDSMLNSYEQYVDKYISLAKKAAKGDLNALSEYPELMEKANELNEKMVGAEGSMSASQWARYLRITNKMATAATEM